MLKTITLVAALAAASATVAAPQRLTDVQYLKAARCEALIASPALGGGDASAIRAVLKAQRLSRDNYIADKADQNRSDAEREARHAGASQKAQLIAERDGICRTFAPEAGATTAGGASAQPNSAN